jgi:phosphatidate cytidylyltransferase
LDFGFSSFEFNRKSRIRNSKSKMLWTRVASAVVFGILVVLIVQFCGPWVFFVTVSVIVILSAIEFSRLAGSTGRIQNSELRTQNSRLFRVLRLVFCVFLAWLLCLSAFKPNWIDVNLVICLAIGLPLLIEIARSDPRSALLNASSVSLGILYIGWLFGRHLIRLRQMPETDGRHLVFLLIGITWSGDIGAYLVGTRFGKHKVIPAISPGKSVEGYAAGIVFSCITALVIRHWLLSDIKLLHVVILGIGLTIIGQIGDLAESLLKRGANVKDSGRLMPGHGGILDRCDSMIFIAPALYYYVSLLVY